LFVCSMRYIVIFLLISSSVLFLSGCGFDEKFETTQQHDGDDINVLQDVWPQVLDQVRQTSHTSTGQNK